MESIKKRSSQGRGRPKGSYKYFHPETGEPIGVFEWRRLGRDAKFSTIPYFTAKECKMISSLAYEKGLTMKTFVRSAIIKFYKKLKEAGNYERDKDSNKDK